MCILKDSDISTSSDISNSQEIEILKIDESMEDKEIINKKLAPDGGWGYMIILGSFFSYFIADGWAYSFGVIFTELLDHFQESHGKTAIIGALVYAVPLTLSPFICALCNLYGCRVVGITGGIICSLAFISSSFAKSVEFLCLTLGIFSSLGMSMTYLSAVLSVTYYFDKKRGFAIGLAVTGSGLGAIIFPPLIELLLKKYTWRGTLLVLGGIFLNVVPSSALFRPLSKNNDKKFASDKVNEKNKELSSCTTKSEIIQNQELLTKESNIAENAINNIPSDVEEHLKRSSLGKNSDHSGKLENYPSNLAQNYKEKFCTKGWYSILIELKELKKTMLNKEVFVSYSFLIFCLSTFITYLWIGTLYVYLVDKAMLLGVSYRYASFLLSFIGIGRTVGQIVLGYLGDKLYFNSVLLYAFSIAVCGIVNLVVPLCFTYISLSSVSMVFGFFVSSTYTLQIVCLVDILGLDKATSAFGILQLIEGIATFIGTPLTGLMYDEWADYSPPFYIAGGMLLISSLVLVPVFVRSRRINL